MRTAHHYALAEWRIMEIAVWWHFPAASNNYSALLAIHNALWKCQGCPPNPPLLNWWLKSLFFMLILFLLRVNRRILCSCYSQPELAVCVSFVNWLGRMSLWDCCATSVTSLASRTATTTPSLPNEKLSCGFQNFSSVHKTQTQTQSFGNFKWLSHHLLMLPPLQTKLWPSIAK